MVHELKCLPAYFADVVEGVKLFEVRRDDRPFAVGDGLLLREWERERGYTERTWAGRITYVLRGFQGVRPDYCVLGIGPVDLTDDLAVPQPLAARISQEEARRRVAVKRAHRLAMCWLIPHSGAIRPLEAGDMVLYVGHANEEG